MAVRQLDYFEQFFDNNGNPLAGGFVYTYVVNSSTPLATYTDSAGSDEHENPIELDSAGRPPSAIYWTEDTAYKGILKTSAGVTLDTELRILVGGGGGAAAVTTLVPIDYLYHGNAPPIANEWLGGWSVPTGAACTLPANFTGAAGHINTNPTASFAIDLRLNATAYNNGTSKGTVTVSTGGAFSFASASGATVPLVAGDHLSAWAPTTPDATANDFNFTLIATGS